MQIKVIFYKNMLIFVGYFAYSASLCLHKRNDIGEIAASAWALKIAFISYFNKNEDYYSGE